MNVEKKIAKALSIALDHVLRVEANSTSCYLMFQPKLDIENPIIRINTAFKGCSSLEKISVLPRIYHN